MSASSETYGRDLIGYAAHPLDPKWPGGARVALQISLAYETGGEENLLHGDSRSEGMLTDIGWPAVPGARSVLVEQVYEYGSRRGVWRLLGIFAERGVKVGVLAVGAALERNPEVAQAIVEAGHEVVCHGYRWIDYQDLPEEVEREYVRLGVESITKATGSRPLGWMTGRPGPNTRRLVVEEGGFVYDRDALNDELPYWVTVGGTPHLAIPYSYECNDSGFSEIGGFNTGEEYFAYHKDAFDMFYSEGETEPKIMAMAVHDRLMGRPARAAGLARFLDYVLKHDKVWICTGIEIARHWIEHHPYRSA